METIIETVTVTTQNDKTAVFQIIEDSSRFEGRRAYVKGGTQYYEMPVFEAGLLKAKQVSRVSA